MKSSLSGDVDLLCCIESVSLSSRFSPYQYFRLLTAGPRKLNKAINWRYFKPVKYFIRLSSFLISSKQILGFDEPLGTFSLESDCSNFSSFFNAMFSIFPWRQHLSYTVWVEVSWEVLALFSGTGTLVLVVSFVGARRFFCCFWKKYCCIFHFLKYIWVVV